MKQIVILIIVYFYFHSFSFYSQIAKKDSIIFWSKNKKLTWDDFKGVKKDTNFIGAKTYAGILMLPYLNDTSKKYSYKVFACFYKYKSSTDTNHSDYILKHEQLHFDIAEIFARKIKQEIEIQESKSSYVNYSSIYNKKYKSYRLYQKLYDAQTNHSTNFEMQKKWKEKIQSELEKLKEYE
ncbi:MAG: DUF922 domain-containing protein [Polaribacter sp.]